MNRIAIAIHGGAGTISRTQMAAEGSKYAQKLHHIVQTAYKLLAEGKTALEAVTIAVQLLENCPLFNAGKGAVLNNKRKAEMDAALMCGKSLKAGAVCGVNNIKNPILLAQKVMEKSPHLMLAGRGAFEFAQKHGIECVDDTYFLTEIRLKQWKKAQQTGSIELDHQDDDFLANSLNLEYLEQEKRNEKFGTVGAVAVDNQGNVAAATSTGGMTNKHQGRIGDSPIIGVGTYANNKTCAISCTGVGEIFMRHVIAYDVSCLMAYKGMGLHEASQHVIMEKLPSKGHPDCGGLIAVDAQGNVAFPYNSTGMYRAWQQEGNDAQIAIFKEVIKV